MEKSRLFLQKILTEEEYHEVQLDAFAFSESMKLYSPEYIDSVIVIAIDNKRFLINKADITMMNDYSLSTLTWIAKSEFLQNPIYVEVEANGSLLID